MRFYLTLWIGFITVFSAWGQSQTLSLEEVILKAQGASLLAQKAQNLKTTSFWEWRTFKSNYKPQIVLSGRLPGFSRTSQEVVQPDGTIKFQAVSQSNILSEITLSQPIGATGSTVFIASNLQRFDDLNQDSRIYNAVPFQLGIDQPFFAFNQLKWDKKIEPLRYRESEQTFLVDMENIAVSAVDLFFYLLVAQIDYTIAATNVSNTDTLYQIAEQKHDMGLISRSDLIQLRLERLRAGQSLSNAEQDLEIAKLNLRLFLREQDSVDWELQLPGKGPEIQIPKDKALREAKANRPDILSFRRRNLEAEMALAKAKGTTGFSASLFASIGFAQTAGTIDAVYQDPPSQQLISLEFTLPIIDWGRTKSQIETAKANLQLEQNEIQQDQIDFEQSLLTELTLFRRYFKQVGLSKEVDELSQMRYNIAQERFLIGDLSITDLTLALREKDQARKDYIRSLWSYWKSYYSIRELTLYDFASNQKIKY
ncbi:MAG: TolC family protein [Bacteroidota bacterium]